ncbi:MAG: hypothetical protein IKO78_06010 [Bacilli bacterium]|nr:hypothetical protein [Bacilli bacterium]
MNKLFKDERIRKIEKIDNLTIIATENNTYCVKKNKNKNIIELFNYLKAKDFNNYLNIKLIDDYEISNYIKQVNGNDNEKLTELAYILAMLHAKTTYYSIFSIDEIKGKYEKLTDQIIDTKAYYEKLFDDNVILNYPHPSMFLLIRNISLILISLDKSKNYLDKWYELIKNKNSIRKVINHNYLKVSNLLTGDNSYLINWYKSIKDSPIYDIESLFKENFKIIDMVDIFDIYRSKYQLLEEEIYLLATRLLLIDKLNPIKSDYINTIEVRKKIDYLSKVNSFLKHYMKD